MWAVATIGLSATAPGQSFSISLFIDHYIADFNLDRTTVSSLFGLGTFLAALSLTWVGRRIDRHGNRRAGVAIAALFALALLACSLVGGPLTILLSFIAIRALGQGSLGLNSSTAVAQWFVRRRGLMMGLSIIGFALFQRIYLPWLQHIIDLHGWRQAWLILGVGIGTLVLPRTWLYRRHRQLHDGLRPAGEAGRADPHPSPHDDNWTLRQSMRTPAFWTFLSARALCTAWGTGLIFHQVSLFSGRGHAPLVAAETYGLAALTTAGFTLISGLLIDRARPGFMIALQLGGLMLANGLAVVMTEPWILTLYALAFGFFMGIGSVFDGTVWVKLYGRRHQGAIRGFVTTASVIGTSIGPIVFGAAYDHAGSYDIALLLGMALAVSSGLLSLLVPMPQRPAAVTHSQDG